MKLFSLVVLGIVVLISSPSAQEVEKRNLIYGGIGTISAPEAISKIVDIWITALSAGYSSSETRTNVPALTLGYQFYESSRFSFGASITYESLMKDVYSGSRKAGSIDAAFLSPMAELRYEYVNNETFGMFMDLGIGACFFINDAKYDDKSDNLNKTILAAQFNPVGLRFGNKFLVHFGLGFGMKGLLTASVGYKF